MNTEIKTVGTAILIQSAIRDLSKVLIVFLALWFANGWVLAYLSCK